MPSPDPWELVSLGRNVEAGRVFEAQGRVHEAIQAYRRAKDWQEAARLLAQEQSFEDAADCLLQILPSRPTPIAELSQTERHAASNAALFYARAGRLRLAIGLLLNLGENERAAEILRRAGRRDDSVQAMRGMHLPNSPWPPGLLSSNLYGREDEPTTGSLTRDPFQLAEHLVRKERPQEALDALQQIPFDHARYPEAVARVVRLVKAHGLMSLRVDQFVAPFVKDTWGHGHTTAHVPTLYALARLYERMAYGEMAELTYDAVVAIDPDYRDVRLRRKGVHQLRTFSDDSLEQILDDDAAFHHVGRRRRPSAEPPPPTAIGDEISTRISLHRSDRTPKEESAHQARVDSRSLALGLGPLGTGSVIADRYRVEAAVGEGGYAVVYRVMDLAMEEDVALKLFLRGRGDPKALERFKQEMRITRKLAHPNIVQVYEFGVWREAYFITMEFLEGLDLHALLDAEGGPLPVNQCLELASQALAGLSEAHRMGVLHRDIKPRNLFICSGTGRLKVTDFGIAKVGGAPEGHTQTGQVVGTPAYIPPERLRSDSELGPSVDLYGLGVCLYRMLTGRLPLDARHIEALFMKILEEVPPPASRFNPAVPPELDRFVARLLEKEPEDRYESCDAAREAIDVIRG